MALPISVTYTFATATSAIPLSQLDSNFSTVVNAINGIGNGTNSLSNVSITGGSISNVSVTATGVANGTSNVSIASANGNVTTYAGGNLALTVDTNKNASLVGTLAMGSSFLRNRIINGAMVIDQRNAGASGTVNSTTAFYPVDRFYGAGQSADGVFTLQQVSDGPSGFTKSIKMTVTTADSSLGATQYYNLNQTIEGLNCTDLSWGSASAVAVTLSFWVKSSVTGTYSGALLNSANNRSYPFTYAINSASTWEYKTVVVPGDTTGTWLTDNGAGVKIFWSFGTGSTFSGTAGSWAGALYLAATGSTNIMATNAATWQMTGVQLEVGSTATPFERRQYGQELALCQRYYQQIGTESDAYLIGGSNGTSRIRTSLPLNVTMRSAPTITVSGTPTFYYYGTAAPTYSSVALTLSSTKTFTIDLNTSGGLTAGQVSDIVFTSSSAQILISAEL